MSTVDPNEREGEGIENQGSGDQGSGDTVRPADETAGNS